MSSAAVPSGGPTRSKAGNEAPVLLYRGPMTSLALEEAWKAVREAPRNLVARRVLAEALEAAGDPRAPFVKTSLAALEQTVDGHAAALALKAFRATASEWLPHRALMNAWGDDGLGMVGSVFASLEQSWRTPPCSPSSGLR